MSVERLEISEICEGRRIRSSPSKAPNSLKYYQGDGSCYPGDGRYLNPDSEYKNRFQDMAKWISEIIGNSGRVLDVGGATGNLGYWMESICPLVNVVHTDYSAEALKFSKELYDHSPIQMDAKELPFADSSFNGVVFGDVLEHLDPKDVGLALLAAHRVLVDNGSIFVNIPNKYSWNSRAFEEISHLWIPSARDMRRLLKLANFSDIKVTTRGFPFSRNLRPIFNGDIHLPFFGTSILVSAKKQFR